MKIYFQLFLCISIIVIIITLLNTTHNEVHHELPVYCLMITGKNPLRNTMAKISIRNFLAQSYKNKHLIILNQSEKTLLNQEYDNILEAFVDNDGKSLGTLRNMSLQFVPPNAIWTTWDDDDWRHPTYLAVLMEVMEKEKCEFLMFQNRLEYNLITKYMFQSRMKSGTMIFFAKQNPYLKYTNIDVLEDKELHEYAVNNLNVSVYDNAAFLYLRLIHNNNTSIYVNPDKKVVKNNDHSRNYFEYEISQKDKKYIRNIISTQYKNVLGI